MSTTLALRRIALVLAIASIAAAGPAYAQCEITGPDVLCGAPVTLCGPTGNYDYRWSSMDGPLGTGSCLQVSAPGSYALEVFDRDNGIWYGPCYHFVASGGGQLNCAISGPTSACEGETVTLCGPQGDLTWSWSGPNGFTASTQCIMASATGVYQLTVRDAAGCSQASCSQTVTFQPCGSVENCPRTPEYWARMCQQDGAMEALAACVDDRSALFSWSDPRTGLCNTLRSEGDGLRNRARGQVAAVWANLCAKSMGLAATATGGAVLDANASVEVPLYRGTVGNWLAQAEAELMAMEGRNMSDPVARAVWRDVTTVGWSINHGHGVSPVCKAQ